jgi:biopolymer transport protein ExbD
MAEMNTLPGKTRHDYARSKKGSTTVDLTPMVDLGFLLITFFILTTTLSQPTVMPIHMPAKGDSATISGRSVLTLIASANNQIFFYEGSLEDALKKSGFGISGYSIRKGIGQVIAKKQADMDRFYAGGRKELTVLIKASPDASFANVVALFDQMAIDQVRNYSMVELTGKEKILLKANKLIN